MINKDFNIKEFKEIVNNSDRDGLNYLFENEIRFYNCFLHRENYIYNLYKATCILNNCIDMYENYDFENKFESNLYHDTRNKLFEELGLNVEEIYS